jgi:O-antigen/teichoic acid export membrane protein
MNNLKSKGTTAFLWDIIGKFAKNGISFIVMIFLARLLEPSDFGLIAMIMVIVGIAQIFSDIGLGSALIQRRHVLAIHYSSVFYFNIISASLLTLAVYFSAASIGNFYNNPAIIPLAQVVSLAFFIDSLSSVQNTKLRRELNYALMTKINLVSSFSSGVIGIGMALNNAGVWSLVAQVLSQGLIYALLIWSAAKWRPTAHFSLKALIQLWSFGFRMFLSGILETIFTRLDYMLIGKLFSPATLGFFQQAMGLNSIVIQYSSGSLMAVLFPVLSQIQKDLPRFQRVIKKSFAVICFVVFLILGGLYVTANEFIILLFGAKWEPAVYYFKILALSGFAYPISALLVNILSSRGNSKAFLRLEIYKKILIVCNFFVLYFYGLDPFLYGLIATSIVGVSLNIFAASKEIHLPIRLFAYPIIIQAVITIAAVIMTIFSTQLIHISLIFMFLIQGILFLCYYLILSWVFKTTSYMYTLEQLQPFYQKIAQRSR